MAKIPAYKQMYIIQPTKKAKAARVMFTYTCPKCGQTFRSAENLNIKCGDCDVAMERA